MATARTSMSALQRLEQMRQQTAMPELDSSGLKQTNYAQQARASSFTPVGQPSVDLAGQEAVVDRKIEQTGRNAVTQSKAWDILGNIIGFNTQTDYEDAKANIDAQQATIAAQQEEARQQAALKEMAAIEARKQATEQAAAAFNSRISELEKIAVTKEDKVTLANYRLAGNEYLMGMNSQDPAFQEAGAKNYQALMGEIGKFGQEQEGQRIQQENWKAEEARAAREHNQELAETIRHNRTSEQLSRDQFASQRVTTARNNFQERAAKEYNIVQGAINDINAALWEASSNNNPTALVSAQKKLAKLTDPTTGVLQGEMRDQLNASLGAAMMRSRDRAGGNMNAQDLKDIQNAALAADRSTRDTYERNLEFARSEAKRDGLPDDTYESFEAKPLFSGEGYGIAPDDEKDKFTYGEKVMIIPGMALDAARGAGSVVGRVFGN